MSLWLTDGDYSPIILTNTRFRRRPSRLPGQPFRLALKDPLPRAKDFGELNEAVEAAIGDSNHDFAAHHAQLVVAFRFRCASATCPDLKDRRPLRCGCAPGTWTGCLRAGVVDENAGYDVRQYSTLHG